MYSPDPIGDFHIFRLNQATQTWVDTGVLLDPRSDSRADVLWNGTHLYVASHTYTPSATCNSADTRKGRLYRYSYSHATVSYSIDSGFPININDCRTETLVIDQDSTGKLWATWTQGGKVWVNRSLGNDLTWGTPFVLPVTGAGDLNDDDISSLIAFGGNRIGVMWSHQNANPAVDAMYFAVHRDGDPDTTWQTTEVALQGAYFADDHINLKALQEGSGARLFAATKTALDDDNPNP